MKSLLILIFVTISAIAPETDINSKISQYLKTGNATELSKFFAKNLEVSILDNDDTYSKTQAEYIIKKFFNENPPIDYSIKHKGETQNNVQYIIGTLKTSQKSFRVYYYLKTDKESTFIKEISIKPEDN